MLKFNFIKLSFLSLFLLFITFNIFSQKKIDDLSFTNVEITEILKSISEIFEVTIVPEKDVTGTVTRYFKDTNLEQTLTLLLEPLGYIYEIKNNVYFVKKRPAFFVEYDQEKKVFTIKANNAKIIDIINEISIKSKNTIIFDGSPNDMVNINIFEKDMFETLKLLTESLKYEVIKKDTTSFAVKKKEEEFFTESGKTGGIIIKGDENNLELKVSNQASNDVIMALFKKFNKKLSLLSTKSIRIPYLDIANVNLEQALNIIFQHSNQSSTFENGIYYIYDSLATKETNPYRITAVYKLKNLDTKSFQTLIPPQVIPPTSYKIDSDTNEIVILGSPSEVEQYLTYIKNIDGEKTNKKFRTFKLKNIEVSKIKNYLPDKFQRLKLTTIEDQNSFITLIDDEDYEQLASYLNDVDISVKKEFKYKFKYLDPDEVLKSMLPKNFKADQFMVNKNDSSIICSINEKDKNSLFEYFDSIDTPHPVIRYQVLIVEYTIKKNFDYNWGLGFKKGFKNFFNFDDWGLEAGIFTNSSNAITASFDIPTIFGNYFAADLAMQLSQDTAKIRMSSEIYGLSGEKVTLTSTKTEQTKDEVVDLDTNTKRAVYTSTVYGLTLEIKGRATSSDEVYIEVSAKHSDKWGQTDGAPNTSEKSVKNSIRTRTGKPIALGGLTSNRETTLNNKIPGLGDIPFLGNLFKTHDNEYTNSEFIIYIIPFIQKSEEDLQKERREYIKKIYNYFFEKNL